MHWLSGCSIQLLLPILTVALLHPDDLLASELCEVCGNKLVGEVYICEDKVSLAKKDVCWTCVHQMPSCYLCSIAVYTNTPGYKEFADGRVLCKRDAVTSVSGAEEGKSVMNEVKEWLNREFSRFMEFTDTNSASALVDRPTLETLFKYPGRDVTCPDIWGTCQRLTNNGVVVHEVSLLDGMPLALLRHSVAHELTHVWLHENVPLERYKRLDRDANEGFCELMAWLVDETCADADLKAYMRRNLYTRGQIDLFLDVYRLHGLNDILDWLKYGVDRRLVSGGIAQINNIVLPSKTNLVPEIPANQTSAFAATQPARAYSTIILQGITWDPIRPLAIVNGNTFGVQEEGRIKIAGTNAVLRCLEIRKNSVRVRVGAQEQELQLATP